MKTTLFWVFGWTALAYGLVHAAQGIGRAAALLYGRSGVFDTGIRTGNTPLVMLFNLACIGSFIFLAKEYADFSVRDASFCVGAVVDFLCVVALVLQLIKCVLLAEEEMLRRASTISVRRHGAIPTL